VLATCVPPPPCLILDPVHVAAAGVSNWNLQDMQELLGWARVRPAVLEARSDPLAANTPLLSFCLQRNITFISYSSLGSQWGWNGPNPVLTHPVLKVRAKAVAGTNVEPWMWNLTALCCSSVPVPSQGLQYCCCFCCVPAECLIPYC
jgi:hypothetical protein